MTHWISHRGLRTRFDENSLAGFKAALAEGFTEIETDLRISKDGEIVLCHDPYLQRVCGRPGMVAETRLRDLTAMHMSGGERLLSFARFAETFPSERWLLDIKPDTGDQTLRKLTQWIGRQASASAFFARTRFLFWRASQQARWQADFPEATCLARQTQCYRAGLSALCHLPMLGGIEPGQSYAVTPSFVGLNLFDRAYVGRLQAKGASVLAFLPQSMQELDQALSAGVDEVLSDGWIRTH